MTIDLRERVFRAALACIAEDGLAATSIEDVARRADVGRATIYRHFPGGREQVLSETVTWEVARFFGGIEAAIADAPDLSARFEGAFIAGDRALAEHELLHRLLRTEPEAILTELAVATELVAAIIVSYVAEQLEREIAAGRVRGELDVPFAADHLGRLFLSYLGTPGRWDLTDPVSRSELVRSQFMVGLRPSTEA